MATTDSPSKQLLTLADLSVRLQVPIPTIRKWIFQKTIPVCRLGKLIRFDPKIIDEWIHKNQGGLTNG